jgi:glycerol-3-phosphate dehydrogenase (NAD(P)+)
VVEGVATAPAVVRLAARHGVEMPIAASVDAVVGGRLGIGEAIQGLLERPLKRER